MVIGLEVGFTVAGDVPTKARVYAMTRDFIDCFSDKHGSILCPELIDCDIGTPEGLDFARD
jgi:hypothetical protein